MSRLSPLDWIAAGFHSLTQDGPATLKAEPLARTLGTTKGSFYWHFKDVPAFHAAMLARWELEATHAIINSLAALPSSAVKLRKLADVTTEADNEFGGVAAEPAIRAWAKGDAAVAAAVRRVDAARLALLSELFADMGMANPDFARLFYAALIGLQDLADGDTATCSAPLSTLADLMIALSETD